MSEPLPLILGALGMGVALASAPGPVQAVMVIEAAHGGIRRGLLALLGAGATFTVLLGAVAVGVSVSPPTGLALQVLKVVGGCVLLGVAWEGWHAGLDPQDSQQAPSRRPAVRGALSVVANPGAWLFVAAVASPMLASATAAGGTGIAILVAAALAAGAAAGDSLLVLASGVGLPRLHVRSRRLVARLLDLLLAGLAGWLLLGGIRGLLSQ